MLCCSSLVKNENAYVVDRQQLSGFEVALVGAFKQLMLQTLGPNLEALRKFVFSLLV